MPQQMASHDGIEVAAARREAGDLPGAKVLAQAVLAGEPDNLDARLLLAVICFELDALDEAAHQFRELLAMAPQLPIVHFGLGNVLRRQERLTEAAESYAGAVEIDPRFLPALANLGTCYQDLGRLDEAVEAFDQAVACQPENPYNQFNLANALLVANRLDPAAEHYRRAIEIEPGLAPAHSNLGVVLRRQGDGEAARGCYERALEITPNHGDAHLNLGHLWSEQGQLGPAVTAYRRACELMPESTLALAALADGLLKNGEGAEALATIDRSLTLAPPSIHALALKSAALSLIGDRQGERRLVDLEGLIDRATIRLPAGFESFDAFNRELAELVTHHPSLRGDKTTVHGRDTDDLFGETGPAITALRSFVAERASSYLDRLEGLREHPLAAHRPPRYHLKAWGVRMWRQGYQVPHYHQNAWISGVYYVQLPDVVSEDDESRQGWIEFGRGTEELYGRSDPALRYIRPEVGTLLIFPSYFWHRTLPFESDSERISIAFDLIPDD